MSDFGFWELAVIGLISLLVIGPERLPHVAKTVGYWVGRIRRMAMMFKSEFLHEAENSGVKKTLTDARDTLESAKQEITHLDPLTKTLDEQIKTGRFTKDYEEDSDALEDETRHTK